MRHRAPRPRGQDPYGAAAGTAYVVLKAAHNSARLEAEQRRRLAQQQGQRAHYD